MWCSLRQHIYEDWNDMEISEVSVRGWHKNSWSVPCFYGTLMDFNLLKFSLVLVSKLQVFSPSWTEMPCFWGLFSLFALWFSPYLGGNNLSRIWWEKNLCPFLFQVHFHLFLSQQKLHGIDTTVLCGKKEKTSVPLAQLQAGRF